MPGRSRRFEGAAPQGIPVRIRARALSRAGSLSQQDPHGERGHLPQPVLCGALQAVNHQEHGDEGQRRAKQIQTLRSGITELRE